MVNVMRLETVIFGIVRFAIIHADALVYFAKMLSIHRKSFFVQCRWRISSVLILIFQCSKDVTPNCPRLSPHRTGPGKRASRYGTD
jgi:hypothetical protein